MKNKIGWYAAGVLALAMVARAGVVIYNATLVNETALAYSNTYSLDLQSNGINALSAQAVYSSATVPTSTFLDGAQSTGSITVVSYASLIASSAVNAITVVDNSNLTGARIVLPGYVFTNGIDWATRDVASNTAVSIKNALATVPWLNVIAVSSVVYATATPGSYYNGMAMTSSNANVVVSTPMFSGGLDNAIISINGVQLRQGVAWNAATSNTQTATNIATAINANALLNTKIVAAASGAVVTATSTINGSLYNYGLVSSTPTAMSVSGVRMVNGTDPGFTLGSSVFSATNGSNLTLALPVLYSSGTLAIGGLSNQTTYYVIPVTGNTFKLSRCSSCAVAGTVIDTVVVTSTNTQVLPSQHTYTLAPLGIAGIPSFKWQVSNDNSNWSDLAVSSVTMGATGTPYATPPTSTFWSFGFIGGRYIRLNVAGPSAGGISLVVTVIGTN